MDGRIPSGHPGLDAVLGGGLPANAINLVMGLPGSGKTTLAQQYVFVNASSERPAFYLSTVSEPFEKMVRYGQTLSFFNPRAVGRSVFYEDLGRALARRGLTALPERISAVLREWQPGLIVIDSFKALRAFAASGEGFRRFLYDLAGRLSAYPVTSLWVGEYSESDTADAPELAVADAIISLFSDRSAERELRLLEVRKLRGSTLLSGKHVYRLSAEGVAVFPRLGAESQPPPLAAPRQTTTGVQALDEMLGGDFASQSQTLLTGPSGSGKTLFGLFFIYAASAEGGIIATFHESSAQLERMASGFGFDELALGVETVHSSAVDVHPDEWAYRLFEAIKRTGARRVFVDGLAELRFACRDDASFREYLYALAEGLRARDVSLLMTSEAIDPLQSTPLGELSLTHVFDNVVALENLLGTEGAQRRLTVIKARAPRRMPETQSFSITPAGIFLDHPLAASDASA